MHTYNSAVSSSKVTFTPVNANADQQSIQAVLQGDRSSFKELVQRHDPALRRVVYSIVRDSSALDDVLQETYVKVFRSLGKYQANKSFKAWIHRIAYTTALDYLRSSNRRMADLLEEDPPERDSQETEVVFGMDLAIALQTLSRQQRIAVQLIDGQGFSYDEVAEVLNIPSGTVGYHLHNGRKQLRRLLVTTESSGDENA